MRRASLLRAALVAAATAFAPGAGLAVVPAPIEIQVRATDGAPVANAVVTLTPLSGAATEPDAAQPQLTMVQHDLTFDPHVLVAPMGSDVAFPNQDDVRHHVYSFSDAKTFELRLYGGETEHVVHFDRPGVVPLGCNIHDNMIAFIYVADTPYAARTDAEGRVRFDGAPAGDYALTVWHELLRSDEVAESWLTIAEDAGASETVTVELRRPRRRDGYR